MDSGLPKHTHLKSQKENNGGEDMISELPEPLISRILSLLPTKEAVRTSVLSKRWIHMWWSITKLDFDDSVRKKKVGKQHFVNFVYRALLFTESSSLESFSLRIYADYDVSTVNTWISRVLNRSLKKLFILSQMELPFSSANSDSLFNSELLEELVLNMDSCAVRVPTSCVHFGNLKSLRLREIKFTLKASDGSKFLSLSFPLLQKFEVIDCTWIGAVCVTFIVPLLERVFMKQEVESPSDEPNHCPIKFAASHLIGFTYAGYVSQGITLLDPSSVRNANASIILRQCKEDKLAQTEFRAFQLLTEFSQVKCLKFERSEVLAKSRAAALPTFGMLNHLELGLVGGEALLGLLLKSPILKTLIFKGLASKIDQELLNAAVVPDCLQHTLEVVNFGEVKGHEHELCLVKFVMENGLVLKRMSFSVAARIGKSTAFEEFKEKLFSFKKSFSFAVVEFSYIESSRSF